MTTLNPGPGLPRAHHLAALCCLALAGHVQAGPANYAISGPVSLDTVGQAVLPLAPSRAGRSQGLPLTYILDNAFGRLSEGDGTDRAFQGGVPPEAAQSSSSFLLNDLASLGPIALSPGGLARLSAPMGPPGLAGPQEPAGPADTPAPAPTETAAEAQPVARAAERLGPAQLLRTAFWPTANPAPGQRAAGDDAAGEQATADPASPWPARVGSAFTAWLPSSGSGDTWVQLSALAVAGLAMLGLSQLRRRAGAAGRSVQPRLVPTQPPTPSAPAARPQPMAKRRRVAYKL